MTNSYSEDADNLKNACVMCKYLYCESWKDCTKRENSVCIYLGFIIYYVFLQRCCLHYDNEFGLLKFLVKNNFPRNFIFRRGRCNVRNTDWLVVALDEPECAGEESVTQLENTWQPFV